MEPGNTSGICSSLRCRTRGAAPRIRTSFCPQSLDIRRHKGANISPIQADFDAGCTLHSADPGRETFVRICHVANHGRKRDMKTHTSLARMMNLWELQQATSMSRLLRGCPQAPGRASRRGDPLAAAQAGRSGESAGPSNRKARTLSTSIRQPRSSGPPAERRIPRLGIRYEISEIGAVLFDPNSVTLPEVARMHGSSSARPARAARRFAMQGRSASGAAYVRAKLFARDDQLRPVTRYRRVVMTPGYREDNLIISL